ncbi:MAG: hypothetical protein J2P53_12210 [Bradyrhizobiaceae bacterium]|nr:hypothetical protein [Bradyrhizobiaceae bacterium]
MALSAEELTEIEQVLAGLAADAPVIAEMKGRFPKLSWTRCDASDVVEAPCRQGPFYDIHLLNSHDHCSKITSDLAQATGIILAKRKPSR